ncbi:MAG: protein translocase subunit SecF [bacterium]
MQISTKSLSYRFDFLKYSKIWIGVSIAYLILGVVGYVIMGGFKYHIDFTGGAEIQVAFENPIDTATVRSVVEKAGWSQAVIQEIGNSKKEFLIKLGGALETGLEDKVKSAITTNVPGNKLEIRNINWVGAEVSSDTTWNAIKAIFLSVLILLLYIAFRFEFAFGMGAVIALLHDLLFVLAFILITGEQVSLNVLAAILAVLGYSVNDTIVIFSRMRENLKKMPGVSEYEIANLSINQTLTRTVLTSSATVLSVLAILFLGGSTLRDLSLIMFIGIVVGAYSSIYIASPVMLFIKSYKKSTLPN